MPKKVHLGDKGETSLVGKTVNKCCCNTESLGNVDELNSYLGLIRSLNKNSNVENALRKVQNDLFVIGTELANSKSNVKILETDVKFLESFIDEIESQLRPLNKFIIPTGSQTASLLHVARTICRRAERNVVALSEKEKVSETILAYLNRLSDLLFVMARLANKIENIPDVKWKR
ncbi:cob(I)yrinic acid a,c-diamide adenosyltransferase [archaeon]|nr:MAG: cob(I)yrinic acid a,c-diamide adenosyltransferase [archaeon]